MALPTTGLAYHFDASTNADVYQTLTPPLQDHPLSGDLFSYWDDQIYTATDGNNPLLLAEGTTPAMRWQADTLLNLPSVAVEDGVFRLRTQGGIGISYAPPTLAEYTLFLSFLIDPAGTYPDSATSYFNCNLVGGGRNAYSGVFIRLTGGVYRLYPYNWDGDEDGSAIPIDVTPNQPHILALRHLPGAPGTLGFAVDGGTELTVPTNATANQTAFFLGDEGFNPTTLTTADFRGRFGELALYNIGQGSSDYAAATQHFLRWLQAPDPRLSWLPGSTVAGPRVRPSVVASGFRPPIFPEA